MSEELTPAQKAIGLLALEIFNSRALKIIFEERIRIVQEAVEMIPELYRLDEESVLQFLGQIRPAVFRSVDHRLAQLADETPGGASKLHAAVEIFHRVPFPWESEVQGNNPQAGSP